MRNALLTRNPRRVLSERRTTSQNGKRQAHYSCNRAGSLCGDEFQGQIGLHRDGAAVHGVGIELPLADVVDGCAGKGEGALQEFRILYGAIATNENLQGHGALFPSCARRIRQGGLIGEKSALGEFRNIDGFDRGEGSVNGLVAARFGHHGGHLRLQARWNFGRGGGRVLRWLRSRCRGRWLLNRDWRSRSRGRNVGVGGSIRSRGGWG